MFRRLRETAPAGLVPLAWAVVAGAHVGAVSTHALFVAHVVMSVLLAAFAVTGWAEMDAGVLRTWRTVIALGFGATALGVGGFLLAADPLLAVALYAWMALPAAGLAVTARAVDGPGVAYAAGAAACVAGLLSYAPSPLAGLALVGLGQTAGILDAVVR